MSRFMRRNSDRSGSSTNANPPLIPAAKLRPVGPRITARPPVMYSHAWSPTPSTTAVAPELRTQNRSPTTPRMNTLPAGRAVEDHVAGDDVLFRDELRRARRAQHERAARQALAEVVVGVAFEPQRDAARHERTEALARPNPGTSGRSCRRAGRRRPNAASAPTRASCRRCGSRCGSDTTSGAAPRRSRARRARRRSAAGRAPCRARGPAPSSSTSSARTC